MNRRKTEKRAFYNNFSINCLQPILEFCVEEKLFVFLFTQKIRSYYIKVNSINTINFNVPWNLLIYCEYVLCSLYLNNNNIQWI